MNDRRKGVSLRGGRIWICSFLDCLLCGGDFAYGLRDAFAVDSHLRIQRRGRAGAREVGDAERLEGDRQAFFCEHARYLRGEAGADVVILDWTMGKGDMPPSASPLGERSAWDRPTVFLGTAGLHHSCAWELAGGSG